MSLHNIYDIFLMKIANGSFKIPLKIFLYSSKKQWDAKGFLLSFLERFLSFDVQEKLFNHSFDALKFLCCEHALHLN